MFGIEQIEYYLPSQSISAAELAVRLGFDVDFITQKLGVHQVFVSAPDEFSSDMAVKAIDRLFARDGATKERIQALVVCTQTPDFQLPQVSAMVQSRAGLKSDVAAFDINLGCSGFVYGLSVLEGFLERNQFDSGLLVTTETYSKIIDDNDRNTKCLFSDAAAVTLVSRKGALRSGAFTFGTHGAKFDSLILRRQSEQLANPHLHMDGRGIFEFVAEMVPKDIRACLAANKVGLDEVDDLVLHQASRFLLDTVARKLGIPHDPRVVNNLDRFANTVSSSIPITLKSRLANGGSWPRRLLLSGFGVGLSWASTVLTAEGPYEHV